MSVGADGRAEKQLHGLVGEHVAVARLVCRNVPIFGGSEIKELGVLCIGEGIGTIRHATTCRIKRVLIEEKKRIQ